MNRFLSLLSITGLCLISAFSTAATTATPAVGAPKFNAYKLEMQLTRDSEIVAKPKITVAFGKPARINLIGTSDDGSIRIQVIATPGKPTANGVATLEFRAIMLERIAGAWVVVAEPSVRAAESKATSLKVDSGAGAMELAFVATPVYAEKAESAQATSCPPLNAPPQRIEAQVCDSLPCPDDKKSCCSAACTDGS